jgi:hypothetical protein
VTERILLGFEVGTGEPVYLPLHHLAIFGMTQLSGKTTTLEALISRSGLRAIAFIVKRGEAGFTKYNLVTPYYKARADWQFVEGLVNVALGEKVKFEPGMRYGIMKVCRGRKDLKEIQKAAVELARETKREFMKAVYEKLAAYLDMVIPELEKWVFTDKLELSEGVNVMNLSGMRLETQHLVIASTIEYAFSHLDHVIVIIPEAWESIPQGKMTPVKWVAQQFIRKGAALGNYMFLDSIPSYEALIAFVNGEIWATSLEELWNICQSPIQATERGEEIREVDKPVFVPGPAFGPNARKGSKPIWVRVRKIIRHPYDGKLLSINTSSGLIDLSANHPIMKIPRYLVPAETLKEGDRVASRNFKERFTRSDGLFVGTEELGWLFGFFAAEGWIHNDHVCLSNKSRELLGQAAEVFESQLHHVSTLLSPRKGVYTLDIYSPKLAEFFKQHSYLKGARLSSRTKIVPKVVMNGPPDVKKEFIVGYMEGDGHYTERKYLSFVSASRPLLRGLLYLMPNSNFTAHIREDKPDVVQIAVNKTSEKRVRRNQVKRILEKNYKGYLYDLEVDSYDHTFYAGIGNIRVHNSQDIGGIDKIPLRQCDNWLMGRMKEAHEVERILKQLLGLKIPKEEIQTLPLGHFYAAIGNDVKKVYVLPVGVPEESGREVALGKRSPESVRDSFLKPKVIEGDDLMWKEKYLELEREYGKLQNNLETVKKSYKEEFDRMKNQFEEEKKKAYREALAKVEEIRKQWNVEEYQQTIAKLKDEKATLETALKQLEPLKAFKEAFIKAFGDMVRPPGFEPSQVDLEHKGLVVNVHHAGDKVVKVSTDSVVGQILYTATTYFKDREFATGELNERLLEHGWNVKPSTLSAKLSLLANEGKLVKTDKGYRLPSMVRFEVKGEVES